MGEAGCLQLFGFGESDGTDLFSLRFAFGFNSSGTALALALEFL